MLDSNLKYWTLAHLGGGTSIRGIDLMMLANRSSWRTSPENFCEVLTRLLMYNLVESSGRSLHRLNPDITYKITPKGSEALECYKRMRYFGTKESCRLT